MICLTAAADDKYDQGIEKKAIVSLGFVTFRNSDKLTLMQPKINKTLDLSDSNIAIETINKERETRSVLVYSCGDVMQDLELQADFKKVNADTSDSDLRNLGQKKNNIYPVYLIDRTYGIRGIDYKAPGNPLGICLVVLSPCNTDREWMQLLFRVGRYGEDCYRIVNSKMDRID